MDVMFVFLISLLAGSFVGALTYRLPRKIGFVYGRSFCDSCGKKLFWYDNIPLFSYLIKNGISSCCHKKISFRYPLIEIATALGGLFLYLILPFQLFIFYYFLFVVLLMVLIIDLEHQFIADELSWLVLFFGFFFLIFKQSNLFLNLFTGFLLSTILLLVYFISRGRGMGLGDVKLILGLGIFFNLLDGFYFLLTAFLTGGIIAFILLLTGKVNLKTKIAFGPFLIFAFWLTLLA